MFEGKDVKVLLAQAGSGKTRRLVDIVSGELEKRRPEEIAMVTFTKKGAEEGLRRVCSEFMYEPEDLPYFRTLHSLTFHALNLNHNQMFNRMDERRFNKENGYELNRVEASTGKVHPTRDSMYLDYYDLERSGSLTSLMVAESDIDMGYYRQLVRKYEEYKSQQSLVDFFDCLIKYVRDGVSLPVKVALIDEAQDITALQWQVVEKAFANAEKIYIAGDDAQAIYSYSGARPDIFIGLARKFEVEYLSQSYRIPRKVYELSKGIVAFLNDKADKPFDFHEGNPDGEIFSLNTVERLKNFIDEPKNVPNRTEWYLLARNKCFLPAYQQVLEESLVPYWTCDGFFMGGEIMRRICDYESFRLDGYGNDAKREAFKKKYGIEDFSQPFTETSLFTEGRKWVYQAYIEKYGLERLKDMCKWYPQILISTIHYVKGGEADNVSIMLDITRKTDGTVYRDIDEELRVLYVGVTRTKQNLYLIDSSGKNGYDKIVKAVKDQHGLEW